MYSTIKRTILKVLPRTVLLRYENYFRFLHYLTYAGSKYQCNICKSGLKSFIALENGRLLCPRCGSNQRARRLWKILEDEFLDSSTNILHFSPSRALYRVLKQEQQTYVSSDLSDDFISEQSYDITTIDAKNESYDLIICYHILEHVESDRESIKEIWRVLETGGYCLIQTPFKEGDIYEDNTITKPEERELHFGQSDHVRVYSVEGLKTRLEEAGFDVEVRNYSAASDNMYGFREDETVLICYKPN